MFGIHYSPMDIQVYSTWIIMTFTLSTFGYHFISYGLPINILKEKVLRYSYIGKLNATHSDLALIGNVSRCDNALVLASQVDSYPNNGVGCDVNNMSIPPDLVCGKSKQINEYKENRVEEKKN